RTAADGSVQTGLAIVFNRCGRHQSVQADKSYPEIFPSAAVLFRLFRTLSSLLIVPISGSGSKFMKIRIAFLFSLIFVAITPAAAQQPTELFLRGYSVIPTPQKVELRDGEIEFNDMWGYDATRIAKDHIAVRSLLRDLQEFYRIELRPVSNQAK